jgi:DNA-binding transcriptional MocR family regulator
MSKAFWGGLRVGWVRASATLVGQLGAARHSIDLAGPVLDQLVAADLLADAEAHLRTRRRELAQRRDVLSAALQASLPQWHWRMPAGGLCLWVRLDADISTAMMTAAAGHGLQLTNGPRFGLDGDPALERFLRLPYVLPPAPLREGVRRLAAAHADVSAAQPAEAT